MAARYPISAIDSRQRKLQDIWVHLFTEQHVELIEEMYKAEIDYLEAGTIDTEKQNHTTQTTLLKKDRKLKDFGKENLQKAVCVCISEEHQIVLVTLSGTSSIAMLNLSDGSLIHDIKHIELKSPWGLAIKDDTIYVTDIENTAVMTFIITQQTTWKVGSISQASFVLPRQLAINCANEVWVADEEEERIVILEKSLIQKGMIENTNIRSPRDIKFTYNKAYILDKYNVHVFDQNTREYQRSIIKPTDIPMQSYFFKIISNLILIPNHNLKAILVYDLSGDKKKEFKVKESAIPMCLDVWRNDIYILYPKLPKPQIKKYSLL